MSRNCIPARIRRIDLGEYSSPFLLCTSATKRDSQKLICFTSGLCKRSLEIFFAFFPTMNICSGLPVTKKTFNVQMVFFLILSGMYPLDITANFLSDTTWKRFITEVFNFLFRWLKLQVRIHSCSFKSEGFQMRVSKSRNKASTCVPRIQAF